MIAIIIATITKTDGMSALTGTSTAAKHEAAAKPFEKHPHFTISPGDSVEIMPALPILGG